MCDTCFFKMRREYKTLDEMKQIHKCRTDTQDRCKICSHRIEPTTPQKVCENCISFAMEAGITINTITQQEGDGQTRKQSRARRGKDEVIELEEDKPHAKTRVTARPQIVKTPPSAPRPADRETRQPSEDSGGPPQERLDTNTAAATHTRPSENNTETNTSRIVISDHDSEAGPYRGQRDTARRLEAGHQMSGEDFCNIFETIKATYPNLVGLDDPAYQRTNLPTQSDRDKADITWQARSVGPPSIQILHVGNNHWVMAHGSKQGGVLIFDTLPNPTNRDEIRRLTHRCFGTTHIQEDAHAQVQIGTMDCGLLALAKVLDIATGTVDTHTYYDQLKARQHLVDCLKSTPPTITPFPTAPPTRESRVDILPPPRKRRHNATKPKSQTKNDRKNSKHIYQNKRPKATEAEQHATHAIKELITHAKTVIHNNVLSEVLRQHLHTRQTVGTDAHVIGDTLQGPWNTDDHLRTRFGAKREDNICFMTNAYSMTNLTKSESEEQSLFREANAALENSTLPTRIALMTQHTNDEPSPGGNFKKILTIHEGTITLHYDNATNNYTTLNDKAIHIYIGEANQPLNYDAQDMNDDIGKATGARTTIHPHGTRREERCIRSHKRNPAHTTPRYQWYRTTLPRHPPESDTETQRKTEQNKGKRKQHPTENEQYPGQALEHHNAILGALGILPPRYRRSLNNVGIPYDLMDKVAIAKIARITRTTMQAAYLRTERWKKRKK